MRLWLLISLFTGLTSFAKRPASPLSGKVELKLTSEKSTVMTYISGGHKRIDEAFSKDYPSALVNRAFEHFAQPLKAMAQLEKLKGPAKGGSVYVYLHEFKVPRYKEKQLYITCGTQDDKGKGEKYFSLSAQSPTGNITSNPEGNLGDFDSLDYASVPTLTRAIASCLAKLPGMPKLKKIKLKDDIKVDADKKSMDMIYRWMMKHKKMKNFSPESEEFKAAVTCIISEAAKKVPNFQGPYVVLRTEYKKSESNITLDKKGSVVDFAIDPFKSKGGNDVAFMHSAFVNVQEWAQIKNKEPSQIVGLWPSGETRDVGEFLANVMGEDPNITVRTCLLLAGIDVPNPEISFPSSGDCKEAQDRKDTLQYFNEACDDKDVQACLYSAFTYLYMDSNCNQACQEVNGKRDFKHDVKEKLVKTCQFGGAVGCYTYLNYEGFRYPKGLRRDTYWAMKRGCQLNPNPACFFYEWGEGHEVLNDPNLIVQAEKDCLGAADVMGVSLKSSCPKVALYYMKMSKTDKATKALEKICKGVHSNIVTSGENICVLYADTLLHQGNIDMALDTYERYCNSFETIGCSRLARYWRQKNELQKAEFYYNKSCDFSRVRSSSDIMEMSKKFLDYSLFHIQGTIERDCWERVEFEKQRGDQTSYEEGIKALCHDQWSEDRDKACKALKALKNPKDN